MLKRFFKSFKKIKYLEYKKRFLLFILMILLLLILALFLLKETYSKYVTDVNIDANITNAMYVFEDGKMSFNIDLNDIIPRTSPYVYTFSVANYNEGDRSDVDIEYTLGMITTTNMPLTYQLYRNENYDSPGATNIISSSSVVKDLDNAWYNKFMVNGTYSMNRSVNKKDIYYLVIYFPSAYSTNSAYADSIDNIEVTIKSYQVID